MACLLTLTAAAPAQARCRPDVEKEGFVLGRTATGYELCGHGVKFSGAGRLVAFAVRGRVASLRFRSRDATTVFFVDATAGYTLSGSTVLSGRERYVRQAFGRFALYVAVGGPRPHIRRIRISAPQTIDARPGIRPRSLRTTRDAVEWRAGPEWRRVSVDSGADLPPADCRVPSYAIGRRRAGEAVTYELRTGTPDQHDGVLFGCFGAGPPHALAETHLDMSSSEARAIAFNGPFAVLALRFAWKDVSTTLRAVDLRSGASTAEAPLAGGLFLALASPSGALAFSRRVDDRQEVVAARGETVEILDTGPEVEGRSLALEGAELTWRNGGQVRRAPLP